MKKVCMIILVVTMFTASKCDDEYPMDKEQESLNESQSIWEPVGQFDEDVYFDAIWGSSKDNIYVVGTTYPDERGVIVHFDGVKWSEMETPDEMAFLDVWGDEKGNVYVIGGPPYSEGRDSRGGENLYKYDGEIWTKLDVGNDNAINAVTGSSANDIHVVGTDSLAGFDGDNWSQHNEVAGFAGVEDGYWWTLTEAWSASPDSVFAVGWFRIGPVAFHYDGHLWKNTPIDVGNLYFFGVYGVSKNEVYAVGHDDIGNSGSAIYHFDGNNWSEIYRSDQNIFLVGIWCSSANDIYVVGSTREEGTVNSQASILHFDGDSWHHMEVGVYSHLMDIWGSSPNDIYTVGQKGTILHRTINEN